MAGMLFTPPARISLELTISTSFHFKKTDQKTWKPRKKDQNTLETHKRGENKVDTRKLCWQNNVFTCKG